MLHSLQRHPATPFKDEVVLRTRILNPCYRRRLKFRRHSKPEDGNSTESLFAKELKRRGIQSDPLNPNRRFFGQNEVGSKEDQLEEMSPLMTDDQYRRSRELQSEGLEGLVPRARELLTLGGTFSLAFLPSIIVVASIAISIYLVFGEAFVHFGRSDMVAPTYVNPYELLGYPYTD